MRDEVLIGEREASGQRLQPSGDEAGTAPGDRRFRPDVQGLRAVAVTLVVLFHAHVPGLGGGYIGVDVFFVISGFVITGVLLRERASTGSTSILHFYARRVRRILPAATLVIVASVIASYALLGPISGGQTAGDARWASLFLINVHFASTGTNYLSSQLPPSVLQNYWSLAVEEQFYLIYPTIFLVVAYFSRGLGLRRRLGIVLGIAVVVSFVVSILQTSSNPTAAYFSPFPRVWELALGGLVALLSARLRRVPSPVAAVAAWLGLGLVLLSAVVFTSSTSYPGWRVALPVVGTALVIGAGVAAPAHGAESLLRLRPFQWIGLISYSLYLWHWPVLTLATERRGTDSLPAWESLFCVLLSLGLAIVTYLLVENPIRHSSFLVSRRAASLALGACLIASSLAVATVELHIHGGGALATPGLAGAETGTACPAPTQHELAGLRGAGPTTTPRIVDRILLVGDSTACTMLPGLEVVGRPSGVQIEDGTVVGCGVVSGTIAPRIVNGVNLNAATRVCQKRAEAAEQRAVRPGPPNVVLWMSSWERDALVVGSGAGQKVLQPGSPQWSSVLLQRMEQRVQQLTASGATLVILTQPPFVRPGSPTQPNQQDESFERLNGLLTAFVARTPHVRVIDLAAHVCPNGPPCPTAVDNVWVRADGAHYSADGSLWVARWLMPQLGLAALDTPSDSLPVMKVVAPHNGARVKGTLPLVATAAFQFGVSKVEFSVTGRGTTSVVGPASASGGLWGVYWHTRDLPNGTYVIRCLAYDSAGQHSTSPGISVRVAN